MCKNPKRNNPLKKLFLTLRREPKPRQVVANFTHRIIALLGVSFSIVVVAATGLSACASSPAAQSSPANLSPAESKALAYHPDLKDLAEKLPAKNGPAWTRGLWKFAISLSAALQPFAPSQTKALNKDVSVYIYRPAQVQPQRAGPILFWIHGGGLIMGDARADAAFFKRVVQELGISVLSVKYRLAEKHPFPAPLDDCMLAYQWMLSQPWIKPTRIIIAGSSAGGGLAAALVQRLHAENVTLPQLQVLVYPMLDDRSSQGHSPKDRMFRVWNRTANRYAWDSYLKGTDRSAPPSFAVPARTKNLSGLPPAWIGVGTLDLFYDEDVAYAKNLEKAGVATKLVVVTGAYHAFNNADPNAPVSRRFDDAQLQAIKSRLDALRQSEQAK